MLSGTWGCLIDAVAIVLKFFLPNSEHLWPLYTLFILVGWSIYAPAQLLVLYSRVHLINQNHDMQRSVLIIIVSVAFLMIVPTWLLVWQAYNLYDSKVSALYSPREAIIDRCTQIGYTIVESVVSSIYIWSLGKLLKLKPTVRQRRVMTDLIYVNVLAVCLDILTVVLVFLNQTGISHPVQTFSYILKLKLEFITLNQLMAVAARGIQKETYAERRYHQTSASGGNNSSSADSDTLNQGLPQLQVAPLQMLPRNSCPPPLQYLKYPRRLVAQIPKLHIMTLAMRDSKREQACSRAVLRQIAVVLKMMMMRSSRYIHGRRVES